jgi:hypothetical protein
MAAAARFHTSPPAERQIEFAGPIRGFSQDADSVTLRLAGVQSSGQRRVTIRSSSSSDPGVTAIIRPRQTHVTLALTPALAQAPALSVTVAPATLADPVPPT